jgi:hypothetical protein
MNTRLSYRYADKSDCRQYTSVVVAGTITWDQIGPYLAQQRSFIPGQIGLEDLQYRFALPGGDHPWHQIAPDDIRPTETAPTIALTAEDLADRFAGIQWVVDWRAVPEATKVRATERAAPVPAADAAIDAAAPPDPKPTRVRGRKTSDHRS